MASQFGHNIRVSIFGQSHSRAIGVNIDGLPAGEAVDLEEAGRFLARRAPGKAPYATARREADAPGRPLRPGGRLHLRRAPVRHHLKTRTPAPKTTSSCGICPGPAHADYTAYVKYGKYHDIRGGGHFSGRLTAPLCFAGAVALQILARRGIWVGAHIAAIAGVEDAPFDPVDLTAEQLLAPGRSPFPVVEDSAGQRMRGADRTGPRWTKTAWAASWSAPPWACPPAWASPCSTAWKTGWPPPCSAYPPCGGWNSAPGLPPPPCGAASTTTPFPAARRHGAHPHQPPRRHLGGHLLGHAHPAAVRFQAHPLHLPAPADRQPIRSPRTARWSSKAATTPASCPGPCPAWRPPWPWCCWT